MRNLDSFFLRHENDAEGENDASTDAALSVDSDGGDKKNGGTVLNLPPKVIKVRRRESMGNTYVYLNIFTT